MTKTEFDLKKYVVDFLAEEYPYAKDEESGVYLFEVYVQYYEESGFIEDIIRDNNFESLIELRDYIHELTWEQESDVLFRVAKEIVDSLPVEIVEEHELEAYDVEELMLGYDIAYGYYPLDEVLEHVEVDLVIALKTMDSPYIEDNMIDFNYVFRSEEEFEDNFEYELGYNDNFEKLFESQGTNLDEVKAYFTDDDYKTDNRFVQTLYNEVLNSYSGNVLAFMDSVNIIEYFELMDNDTITINKGTASGLIDPAMGGGSILELELVNDFTIDRDNVHMYMDGDIGYSVKDTYGMRTFKDFY